MNRKWKICERFPGAATLILLLALVCASPVIITRARSQERGVGPRSPSAGGGAQTRRIALVIGNSKYADKPLANAENDAVDMAAILGRLGFEVIQKTNQGEREMKLAIREFGQKLEAGEGNVGLFYFAGHGIQVKGQNFMIPIDASVTDEVEAEDACVNLELVLGKMEKSRKGLNIVILDACRDNPFRGWRSSGSNGLAYVNAPRGTLIAYATSPGRTASDGNGRNSPYTRALLRHIGQPDNHILKMFELVRRDVEQETGEKQTPWESTSVTNGSEFYLAGVTAAAGPPAERPARAPTRPSLYARSTFTTGQIIDGALRETQGECEVYTEDLGNGVKLEMVKIPGGDFLMGSLDSEDGRARDEGPVHRVRVKGFLMGRYEVTQKEWSEIAKLPKIVEELNPDSSMFKGDALPVERVSWDEVKEFIARLNRKLGLEYGKGYRLPSEAEWEYAARGGRMTPFGFGETISPSIVNYDGNNPYGRGEKGKSRAKTIEVGSLGIANWYGLYEMHGNVWEWCEDEWHDSYKGAPVDGRAWVSSAVAANRAIRGGSWYDDAVYCRSASRYGSALSGSYDIVGFRLSRTLP